MATFAAGHRVKMDRQRGAVTPELAAIGKIGESFQAVARFWNGGQNAVAQLLPPAALV